MFAAFDFWRSFFCKNIFSTTNVDQWAQILEVDIEVHVTGEFAGIHFVTYKCFTLIQ